MPLKPKSSRFKIFAVAIVILIAVAAGVALREYLLLKRIQDTLKMPAFERDRAPAPVAETTAPQKQRYVYSVSRSPGRVEARVSFSAFKKAIENNPDILRQWGTLRWKVLEDTPALCIRNLAADTPFAPLGVQSGECVTHIDGETINQPMRNLGIWLGLASRKQVKIETLRSGRKISYLLTRN